MRGLCAIAVLCAAWPALAYWGEDHQAMHHQLFEKGEPWGAGFTRGTTTVVKPNQYLGRLLYLASPETAKCRGVAFDSSGARRGTDVPGGVPTARFTLQQWAEMGGLWEDGFVDRSTAMLWAGLRAVNHFHDPLSSSGGYTGFQDGNVATGLPVVDAFRPGVSVTRWVQNGSSGGASNKWGYPTIGTSLRQAFLVGNAERREERLADAFRALGQVMHLVADNTVPDHARDLAHPGNGWEEYVRTHHPSVFRAFPRPWVEFPVKTIAQRGLRALWDRDVYALTGGTAATLSTTDPPGLTEFVNANFLAWNRFDDVIPRTRLRVRWNFSTVPDRAYEPFERVPSRAPGPFSLLATRGADVTYPYPRLGVLTGRYFASDVGSLPFEPIAIDHATWGRYAVDETTWAQFVTPLMSRALGYSQSIMSLALQPARAELVTRQNGDLLTVGVRLWNLWPQSGPHSISWKLDEIVVAAVRPGGYEPGEALISIPLGGVELAPEARLDPVPTVPITWAQRAALARNTHTVAIIRARLSDPDSTPLEFVVPIPNAFPLIQQTSTWDLSPPYDLGTGDCSPTSGTCTFSGEVSRFRNPREQRVTGKIELLPPRLDILGRPADPALETALREDARVAEVFIFALPRSATQQDYRPVYGLQSQLAVTGGQLERLGPTRWARRADAEDKSDGAITFEAALVLDDFYFDDLGDPLADATRASGTVFLGVLTTAGGLYLQRLMLWPLRSPLDAAQVTVPACNLAMPRGVLYEDRSACILSDGTPNPTPCAVQVKKTQVIFGDSGGLAIQLPLNPQLDFIKLLSFSNDVRPKVFAGFNVQLNGEGQLPDECDQATLASVYPSGNGSARCWTYAPTGLAVFDAVNTTASGACPPATRIARQHRATYRRLFFAGTADVLRAQFGLEQLPAEWEFDLQ